MQAGELIRTVRERNGISQQTLARRAGTSQGSISRIERGEVSPATDTLARLLAAMGEELVLDATPRAVPFDADDLRARAGRPASERLALSLSWNRFAGKVAIGGAKARGER